MTILSLEITSDYEKFLVTYIILNENDSTYKFTRFKKMIVDQGISI